MCIRDRTYTDINGYYILTVPIGQIIATCSATGYTTETATPTILPNVNNTVDFVLTAPYINYIFDVYSCGCDLIADGIRGKSLFTLTQGKFYNYNNTAVIQIMLIGGDNFDNIILPGGPEYDVCVGVCTGSTTTTTTLAPTTTTTTTLTLTTTTTTTLVSTTTTTLTPAATTTTTLTPATTTTTTLVSNIGYCYTLEVPSGSTSYGGYDLYIRFRLPDDSIELWQYTTLVYEYVDDVNILYVCSTFEPESYYNGVHVNDENIIITIGGLCSTTNECVPGVSTTTTTLAPTTTTTTLAPTTTTTTLAPTTTTTTLAPTTTTTTLAPTTTTTTLAPTTTTTSTNSLVTANLSGSLFSQETGVTVVLWTLTLSSPVTEMGAINFPVTFTNTDNTGTSSANITIGNGDTIGSTGADYIRQVSNFTATCTFDGYSGYTAGTNGTYEIPAL